jgi:nucleotide-binding universal stress UspA family protein
MPGVRVMKTILGLIGGGERDDVIMKTAFAAAAPLSAHLNFLHVHVSAGIAARYDNAVQFAVGPSIGDALRHLTSNAQKFSTVAEQHFREFCGRSQIEIRDAPTDSKTVTASFREENDTSIEQLVLHASQADLVVLGRAKQTQGLSPDTLERLIRICGRPVLVAATTAPQTLPGTVMVCWQKSDSVARAVAAAMPLLTNAKRVVFTTVTRRNRAAIDGAHDLVQQLARNGVLAEVRNIEGDQTAIPTLLAHAAEDCRADLVVTGAYDHSRVRELIFGSGTEDLIHDIDRPMFLMH